MPQCRFCLEDADEDQLIAPCNCDGSHKFVHQECLREWRRGRAPPPGPGGAATCATRSGPPNHRRARSASSSRAP